MRKFDGNQLGFLSSNTQDFIEVAEQRADRVGAGFQFLSSNTQDFIEVTGRRPYPDNIIIFLSSNTQDFIEVRSWVAWPAPCSKFLSSNTQDFIEVIRITDADGRGLWHS